MRKFGDKDSEAAMIYGFDSEKRIILVMRDSTSRI